jgi:hypothetical protein
MSIKKYKLDKTFPIRFGRFNGRRMSLVCGLIVVQSIAYLEIYNDQLCDLLRTLNSSSEYQQQSQQLSISDSSGLVHVKGLTYRIANNEEDALNLLFEGETNRAIGQHVLNKQSSRSHCIFTILIECRSLLSSDGKYTVSKLNLVDLAGSERLAKTNVNLMSYEHMCNDVHVPVVFSPKAL